jgi:CBS domain-containing protein
MDIQGTVQHILRGKPEPVWSTSPAATVFEALKIMGEKNIGALVVVRDEVVVGVLSERDYSRKIVLQGRTSRDTTVGEILSHPVQTVTPADTIARCLQIMTASRIRHLPVLEGKKLVGLVSMGDLVKWIMESQHQTIQQLQGYISGGYPG